MFRRFAVRGRTLLLTMLLVLLVGPGPLWRETQIAAAPGEAPVPLLSPNHQVDWWFVFKFNAASFPRCGGNIERVCTFGGSVRQYDKPFGQQFAFASSTDPELKKGSGCAGEARDPLGTTFGEIYSGNWNFVVWNDQFYDDPKIHGCSISCSSPWGHSKGLVAWNDTGEGLVLQVTTPSWPAAGSAAKPRRTDGNTLGCVTDNDVEVSQHFFALRLSKGDLVKVLHALGNASVVTDVANPQIVKNGGPEDVRALVSALGAKSTSTQATEETLSTGTVLISKPSRLHVPPWQLVSSLLGGVSLRTANWWQGATRIPSTIKTSKIKCWNEDLAKPGPVKIATTGSFDGVEFGLAGGSGPNFNHAKVGVSTSGARHYTIFGDLNQQGSISGPNCGSSQNGRGGLFFVLNDETLFESITALIDGDTAPTKLPAAVHRSDTE